MTLYELQQPTTATSTSTSTRGLKRAPNAFASHCHHATCDALRARSALGCWAKGTAAQPPAPCLAIIGAARTAGGVG
jgi:hypothetical protein